MPAFNYLSDEDAQRVLVSLRQATRFNMHISPLPIAKELWEASPVHADTPSDALREEIVTSLRAATKLGGCVELVSPARCPTRAR